MGFLRKMIRKCKCLLFGHDPVRHFVETNIDMYSPIQGTASSLGLSGRSHIECQRCGCVLSISVIDLPVQCKRNRAKRIEANA